MAEEYGRQTADKLNPLKDEPWLRHQWTEGGSLAASVQELRLQMGLIFIPPIPPSAGGETVFQSAPLRR